MAGNMIGAAKRVASLAGLDVEDYRARIAAGEKFCWRCRRLHPRSAFTSDANRPDGLAAACAESSGKVARARYTPRPRESKIGQHFVPTRDGDKLQARARVNQRVRTGLLPAPNDVACTDCGHVYAEGERRHEYDHHLGYSADHQLDVEAVCTTCHHAREENRRG